MIDPELIGRIRAWLDARDAPGTPVPTGIPGFTLVRCTHPTRLEPMVYKPLLCVVLQGCKESWLGPDPVRFCAGQSLVVSLDLPSLSRVTEASPAHPYVAFALELDPGLVRDLDAELVDAAMPDGTTRSIVTGRADEALIDAMRRLFDLVDHPTEQPVMAPLLRREIHFRAMLSPHGGTLRQIARRDSRGNRIARAVTRIRNRFNEPLPVRMLADLAGMSESSFHQHFKAMTGTTPLRFQKDLRLLEAQHLLSAGGDSVAAIAYEVGYESPAQFSRDYSRKFGAPPSAHLAHA